VGVVVGWADPFDIFLWLFGDDPPAGPAGLVPLCVDLRHGFGGEPPVVQRPVHGGEHVGLGQASVLVAGVVDAGIEGLGDVRRSVQHMAGVSGQKVECQAPSFVEGSYFGFLCSGVLGGAIY